MIRELNTSLLKKLLNGNRYKGRESNDTIRGKGCKRSISSQIMPLSEGGPNLPAFAAWHGDF